MKDSLFKKENFLPAFRELLQTNRMPGESLDIGLPINEAKQVRIRDRHSIMVVEDESVCAWQAPSLRELFRGNRVPPVMGSYPPDEYTPMFYFIERNMILACDVMGDRTDGEFHDLYSALRRRPDGKSLGVWHDFLWQTAAVLLAMQPLSALEFEAIIGRLALSAKHFSIGLVSRNYIYNIRNILVHD